MGDLSHLLKESWALVEERQDKLAGYFYARIFLSCPGLRDLFPVQMDVQRARLLGAIVTAVQNLDEPERLDGYLRDLGRDHRKYQVEAEHYAVVGDALLESLRTFAGERWTPEFERAWRDGYELIARKMIEAAAAETSPAFWVAEVLSHERRGRDVAVITVLPGQALEYRAGQYVSVECPAYQPRVWRNYSMANAPRRDQTLEFHVRARSTGWVSGALVRRVRAGDLLRLAAPMGSMTLDRRSTRDIVCVAGSTGLAPIKALLEELTRYNRTRWVHVFFGGGTREDLYDLPELRAIAAQHPWVSLVPACSRDAGFDGEHGNVSEIVGRYGPWSDHDFYVAGSSGMVHATLATLATLDVPAARIRYDAFGVQ
ncbi:globin domain-containing protein [Catenuloplanes atrovinosus]|uniref:nitric oxide dioxygenase n=1 Tax=Catenuloplanes atrovinosus TaxID=137266 RepID=A0AAE3YWY1_9ACTN|nr:globin domain-containing protein [Catenuloplanes atrovinosus]MDR7279918.1 NAD(P)H-flavin reductase/hemoglobin-like flavoprotein [Catenuloplanes atrovinosus]